VSKRPFQVMRMSSGKLKSVVHKIEKCIQDQQVKLCYL
jgi:hypothetical protein